jgi:hypothetical protein
MRMLRLLKDTSKKATHSIDKNLPIWAIAVLRVKETVEERGMIKAQHNQNWYSQEDFRGRR